MEATHRRRTYEYPTEFITPGMLRRLLEWGVDGIISDRPDVAADVVREWAGTGARR